MARKPSKTLTDGELRIMDVIWDKKQVTVSDVVDALKAKDNLAYNTVQTMMKILEDKGYLQHEKQGRSFRYTPIVDRHSARSQALKHLIGRFFDDSPQALMVNLLEDQEIDAAELEKLRSMIENSDKEKGHE